MVALRSLTQKIGTELSGMCEYRRETMTNEFPRFCGKSKENPARGVQSIAKYGNTGCRVFKGEGSTKLERFLPKNQHTQRKLLNFENWVNGEVSKIGHHFRK